MIPENNREGSQDAFREILLQHARHPKRVGELRDAHGIGQCHNPLCGDKVSVSIITENGLIQKIRISPSGCSISIASASLMSDMIEGLKITEVLDCVANVKDNFSPASFKNPWPLNLSSISALKRIRENPLKIPCVLISWIALFEAINDFQNKRF